MLDSLIMIHIFLFLSFIFSVHGKDVNSSSSFIDSMMATARTIDIGSIDFDAIIERLISPTGLVILPSRHWLVTRLSVYRNPIRDVSFFI